MCVYVRLQVVHTHLSKWHLCGINIMWSMIQNDCIRKYHSMTNICDLIDPQCKSIVGYSTLLLAIYSTNKKRHIVNRVLNMYLYLIILEACRTFSNLKASRDFVRISTSRFYVVTYFISTTPCSTNSLMKWCMMSICLVLLCCTRLFVILMVLVLSQHMVYFFCNIP